MPAMGAYVAMARVERGRVRALAWDEPLQSDLLPDEAVPAATSAATASLEPDDATSFGEQLERLRDQVSMVTFYLTDPESWR
jgi:hypothetical protein